MTNETIYKIIPLVLLRLPQNWPVLTSNRTEKDT